jgi:psiF repeat
MKALLILVAAVTLLVGTVTASPADDKKLTPQQEKMKTCNADAADKKGDERKAFMSQCLKGGTAAPMTQQDKMKKCNVDAGDKKGDERKAFMSQCLKSDKKS